MISETSYDFTVMMTLLPVLKNANSKSILVVIIGSHVFEASAIVITDTKLVHCVILPSSAIHAKLTYIIP